MLLDRVLSYQTGYGDATYVRARMMVMMMVMMLLLWMTMLLVVMMPTLTAKLLQTAVTTMLTTLVPTTVVRAARTTMCFAARHATLHERNFTSAWLKASSKRQFSRRLCLGARKFAATSSPKRRRLRVSGRGCTVDTEG